MANNPIRWYDLIAPLYDIAVRGVYTKARKETTEQLQLSTGLTVLDVACGTGENFRHVMDEIGPTGNLIGTDFSTKMLAQAERKIKRNQWDNVHLLLADAQTLSIESILAGISLTDVKIGRVICTLGYSVIPGWEKVFERTWEILEPGGRYAIMDWHESKPTFFTRIVDRFAASDISRRWWQPLQSVSTDYQQEIIDHPMFKGRVSVASGSK